MLGKYNVYWLSVLNNALVQSRQNPRQPCPQLNQLRPISVVEQPRRPNAFGLIDTLGNVWELCSDTYIKQLKTPRINHLPINHAGNKYRTKRGGGFLYGGPSISRCSSRGAEATDASRWALGFRVVRSLVIERSTAPEKK